MNRRLTWLGRWLGISLALQAAAGAAVAAAACSANSPAHSVALLELYTSEGCDSCPPADRYLSGLRAAGLSSQQAVLLSLHVDYWNYIGWKDPFSRAAFTERQRYLSDLAGSRTIYTPEIFIDGREHRGGVGGWPASVPIQVKRINATPARADIGITLGQIGASGLPVEIKASAAVRGAKLHVALVESALSSTVTAGENRGHVLKHDFVVREWLAPQKLAGDGARASATLARVIPVPPGAQRQNLGLVAFVQSDRGEVLQAFTLPVCAP